MNTPVPGALAALVSAAVLALTSCAPGGLSGVTAVDLQVEVPLTEATDSPRGTYEVHLADLKDPGPRQAALRVLLYGGLEPRAWAEADRKAWTQGYRDEALPILTDQGSDDPPPAVLNYFTLRTTVVAAALGPITVVEDRAEAYRGGAHGSHFLALRVLDLDQGTEVPAQDLLKPGAWDQLKAPVEADLRRQYNIAPDEALNAQGVFFEADTAPPAQAAPTPEGLELVWNEYEIAPYAVGLVRVTVPWASAASALAAPWAALLAPWTGR